jgi:hypothetical protein
MPRASRAKVAKVPQAEEPSDDEVPAVSLLRPAKAAKPKATQPIMQSLNEVMRELEERRANPIDVKELKLNELLSKLKTLREKVQIIFATCITDLEDLTWSLD